MKALYGHNRQILLAGYDGIRSDKRKGRSHYETDFHVTEVMLRQLCSVGFYIWLSLVYMFKNEEIIRFETFM